MQKISWWSRFTFMPNACILYSVYFCTVYGRICLYFKNLIWVCFIFAFMCLCVAFIAWVINYHWLPRSTNICTVYCTSTCTKKYFFKSYLFIIHMPPLIRCQNIHISANCCLFKKSKFYIVSHILYGYRYIFLEKKEWLYALEKENLTIVNTVVENLLLFFLFMYCL